MPSSSTLLTRSRKERASAATYLCEGFCITYFASQIATLMYTDSICDAYYESCIKIVIHYISDSVSVSDFCVTYLSYSICNFSDILLQLCSTVILFNMFFYLLSTPLHSTPLHSTPLRSTPLHSTTPIFL